MKILTIVVLRTSGTNPECPESLNRPLQPQQRIVSKEPEPPQTLLFFSGVSVSPGFSSKTLNIFSHLRRFQGNPSGQTRTSLVIYATLYETSSRMFGVLLPAIKTLRTLEPPQGHLEESWKTLGPCFKNHCFQDLHIQHT